MSYAVRSLRRGFISWILLLIVGVGAPANAQHTADQDTSFTISLSELLRVIQFFNSDGFHCDEFGEDGYAPGTGATACLPHDTDYSPQDWQVSLSELLRLIQFFNVGEYHCDNAGEDGFAVGPAVPPCDGPPDSVVITAPMENDLIYAFQDDEVGPYTEYTLTGNASDAVDGPLTGTSLEWRVNYGTREPEFLGTGESLTARLYSFSCGGSTATITLTAIDSAMNRTSTSVDVIMGLLCK